MTYDASTPILGTGTVSAEAIQAWFAAKGPAYAPTYAPDGQYKPAPLGIGHDIVAVCREWGINHDVMAAQILHESAAWQSRIVRDKHNPSGLGAENDDPYGKAIAFPTPFAGIRATAAHLMVYAVGDGPWAAYDPRYAAVKAANWLGVARTWGDLGGKWATDKGYGGRVAKLANDLADFANNGTWTKEPPMPPPSRVVRVALAAGHHNTSGGDAHETQQTGQLTPRVVAACRALGMDVRVITPDEGRGMFPGTLSEAARRVVEWHAAGWPADVYLEVHTEGNGAGDRGRGAFAIYPDWGDDVDVDVRDRLGPDLVRRLRDATGLPLRGNGVMSEKQTGVGSQGHRLGVFGATASIRATCTRLIVEYGSHTSPADLAIWARPDFLDNAARATAAAIAAFAGVAPQPQPEPQPQLPPRPAWVADPDARYWPETGQWTQWAFNGRVNELGPLALLALGLPIGPETRALVDGVERTVQPFERGWLGFYPEDAPPWHARHLTIDEVMAILEPEAA